VQLDPQLLTLELETQLLLHTCVPEPQIAQTLPAQYCVEQSDALLHPEPCGHVFPCESHTPPQSTPVSSWFCCPSLHESATQASPTRW
jgi:hypothetical protein